MTDVLRLAFAALFAGTVAPVSAVDCPTWGYDLSRNQVSAETGILSELGVSSEGERPRDIRKMASFRWAAELGGQTYGNPVVAGGRVYVGTNNGRPRDPKYDGTRAALYCFSEADGRFLWQLNLAHIGSNEASICSPVTVEGDRVYLVTSRSEVVCLDVDGMADGNDGPFQDEGAFFNWPQKDLVEVGPRDADVLWYYRLMDELDIAVHGASAGSVLLLGDLLYVNTSNGVDRTHTRMLQPEAPALVALDKRTGDLRAVEQSGISARTFHGNWSSPSYGEVNGQAMVIFGTGGGRCYGFDPVPVPSVPGVPTLRELWRFDCNPPEHRVDAAGEPRRVGSRNGPNEVIATPVFHDGRVYVATGRDLLDGPGPGALSCYDVTKSSLAWRNTEVGRSVSTVAVAGGLCFLGDLSGTLHCVDAATGETLWTHATRSRIIASPLVVDGKVIVGDADGVLHVLALARARQLLGQIDSGGRMFMTPVAANGRLYVANHGHLYGLGNEGTE